MIERDWLCLELLKTRGWEARDRDDDVLRSGRRFVAWARKEDVLSSAEARALADAGREEPARLTDVLERTGELRALLHRIFSRVAEDRPPEPADLRALERTLEATDQRLSLVPDDTGTISWQWTDEGEPPLTEAAPGEIGVAASRRILGAVARSAADLLSSGELERVKVCDAHDCGWYFVDVSRNRSRRWCDMAGCGNRSKARRYRERHA